jgi:hypothetical protein
MAPTSFNKKASPFSTHTQGDEQKLFIVWSFANKYITCVYTKRIIDQIKNW